MTTFVEGDQKTPFLVGVVGGRFSISWIALFYPWATPYNAEC